MPDAQQRRREMVDRQIAARGIACPRVLDAMRAVPREAFLDDAMAEFAYADTPLPIEAGQTISQPFIVALMTEALALAPGDKVLEVGTGSGYAAAVLGLVTQSGRSGTCSSMLTTTAEQPCRGSAGGRTCRAQATCSTRPQITSTSSGALQVSITGQLSACKSTLPANSRPTPQPLR